jgi:CheY-like chemotaxis protein/nitrogen-specific signal transduction histidine kinase
MAKRKAKKRAPKARKPKRAKLMRAKPKRATPRRSPRAKKPDNAAIEASLAGIAHDVRTPLTGILAFAELLASSDLGERERQWAAAIKSGAEHLAALTTLIVDAVKEDAKGIVLRREVFPPRRLAEAVGQALVARAQSKGLKADISIARDIPAMVAGDPMRMRAALENLAENAVKFTGKGAVSMQAAAQPLGRKQIRLTFTFSDSGVGLSAAELKNLFQPFAQASEAVSRQYGGAGLGLVFVRRVARALGGDLKVESKPGKGSTFHFTVIVDRAEIQPGVEAVRQSGRGRALHILCAEDNPYGRVVMNTILTELGHKTDFVETGEAAVKAVSRGSYDAVLMDVTLSGMDGIEATRCIRVLPGLAGRIPILGISGRTGQTEEMSARAAGMNFYFGKPVSPGKLAEALASIQRR